MASCQIGLGDISKLGLKYLAWDMLRVLTTVTSVAAAYILKLVVLDTLLGHMFLGKMAFEFYIGSTLTRTTI